jgi:hypothetical protein
MAFVSVLMICCLATMGLHAATVSFANRSQTLAKVAPILWMQLTLVRKMLNAATRRTIVRMRAERVVHALQFQIRAPVMRNVAEDFAATRGVVLIVWNKEMAATSMSSVAALRMESLVVRLRLLVIVRWMIAPISHFAAKGGFAILPPTNVNVPPLVIDVTSIHVEVDDETLPQNLLTMNPDHDTAHLMAAAENSKNHPTSYGVPS